MPMDRLGERRVEVVLEHVMQVAERLLLRYDVDVKALCVGDERAHVLMAHAAAGRRDERARIVGERVLVIRRVYVELVCRECADFAFLELERRNGAAREIVVEAAVLHRGPVADDGELYARRGAIRANELLERLRAI